MRTTHVMGNGAKTLLPNSMGENKLARLEVAPVELCSRKTVGAHPSISKFHSIGIHGEKMLLVHTIKSVIAIRPNLFGLLVGQVSTQYGR